MHDVLTGFRKDSAVTVKHIVMLEFNDDVSEEDRMAALKTVEGLKGKIDGVEEIETGKDFSGRAGNFTHAVIITMRDKATVEAYGPHPAHKEVQAVLGPIVATLWVIDFEVS